MMTGAGDALGSAPPSLPHMHTWWDAICVSADVSAQANACNRRGSDARPAVCVRWLRTSTPCRDVAPRMRHQRAERGRGQRQRFTTATSKGDDGDVPERISAVSDHFGGFGHISAVSGHFGGLRHISVVLGTFWRFWARFDGFGTFRRFRMFRRFRRFRWF